MVTEDEDILNTQLQLYDLHGIFPQAGSFLSGNDGAAPLRKNLVSLGEKNLRYMRRTETDRQSKTLRYGSGYLFIGR